MLPALLPAPLATLPRAALLLGTVLGTAAGCLSPQDIELELPPEVHNEPPIIDILSVLPRGTVCVPSSGESVVFSLQVEDANGRPPVQQPLVARWFVDYDLNASEQTATTNDIVRSQELRPLVAGETVAYPRAELTSSIIRGRLEQRAGSDHWVEVVISDGFDDSNPEAKPRNRTVRPGAYAATYKWPVRYQQGGTCDSQ